MEIKKYDTMQKYSKIIRQKVFIEEQGFENEFDGIDDTAIHLVAFDENKAIATCRIFYDKSYCSYMLGRIAVLKEYRKMHIGKALMDKAEEIVREKKGNRISLSAQVRVSGFYEKQGFLKQGQEYDDEGVPHILMTKKL